MNSKLASGGWQAATRKSSRRASGVQFWFCLPLLFVAVLTVRAADDDDSDKYRITLDIHHPIWSDLTGVVDLGYRWDPDLDYQTYAVLWPGLIYSPSKWAQVSAGLWTFYTDNQRGADNLELRPYAGLKLFLPNKLNWNIYNDTHYEFRDAENIATHDWSSYSRIRSQFGLEIPLTSREQAWHPKTWYARADVEPYYRFDQNTVDPLRVEVAIGHIWSNRFRWELSYIAQFSRAPGGGSLGFNENIISLNLQIGLKELLLQQLKDPFHDHGN